MTIILPDYADHGSSFPVFRPPYLQKDASLAAFLFQADIHVLSALCNSRLNVSDSFAYEYRPISSSIMLVFADMLVSSLDERDQHIGLIPEMEVGFWVLTVAMKKTKRGCFPSHLAWFLPYLFVDEGNSIATGREVLGFNKQFAKIQKPEWLQKPEFSVDVLGFKQFGKDVIAKQEHLIHLRPFASSLSSQPGDFSAIKSSFIDTLLRHVRAGMDKTLVRLVSRLLNDTIPLVFLKQFRDAQNPQKACYQRIIEAPLKVLNYYDGGIFLKPYMLNVSPLASHPLAQSLGLEASQGSKVGAWMNVDFILGNGMMK